MLVVMWNCNSRNMTERNLFINVLFLVIAIIFSAISQCSSVLSDKRLCYDPDCSEPISLARTTIRYSGNESGLLTFAINENVTIYSKEAGKRTDLWGVEINGKRGYVPKQFLREYKILHKTLQHEVPTKPLSNNNVLSNGKLQSKKSESKSEFATKAIKTSNEQTDNLDVKLKDELPHGVTPPYKIIDGTKVHLDYDEPPIKPTFLKEVIQATVVPNKQNVVDDSGVSFTNDKTKSNIVKDDKIQEALHDKLETEKQTVFDKVDIKDFVTSSKEILESSEIVGIHSLPLNVSAFSNKTENIESLENNSVSDVKDSHSLEKVSDINDSQTSTYDVKKTVESNENNTTEVNQNNIPVSAEEPASSDIKPDVQSLEITTSDTASDTQNIEGSDNVKTSNVHPSESDSIIATTDTKLDIQNAENSDKIEKKDFQSSDPMAVDSNTTSDTQNIKSSDKIDENNKDSSESVTTIITSDIKSHIQTVESSNETEANFQSSESIPVVTTSDTVSDTKSIESSDKVEASNIHLSESDPIATSDIKLDIQNAENSDKIEKEDFQSSDPIAVDSNTTSETQNIKSSDKIEENNVDPLESVIGATSDTKPDIQNEESSSTADTKSVSFLESVITHTEDTEPLESVTQLESEQNKLKKEEENKNIENLNKQDNDEHISFFSLQQTENIETSAQTAKDSSEFDVENVQFDSNITDTAFAKETEFNSDTEDTVLTKETTLDVQDNSNNEDTLSAIETSENIFHEIQVSLSNVCPVDNVECSEEIIQDALPHHEQDSLNSENAIINGIQIGSSHWMTLIYLSVTATAMLIFSLGYYCIENMRRDKQLIARINKLEKDLLISEAECTMMNESLKSTKEKLSRMEDESFGSDEMVLSLRADLEASQNAKVELEDQVAILEKDLESATEAGLELEKMLREVLSSNNEVNPLAQSIEDLQTRLNAQQAVNESLTNALNLKTQENESLSAELVSVKKRYEELEVELTRITENLKTEINSKNSIQQTLTDKVQQLEMQIKEISTERVTLQKELKSKEIEVGEVKELVNVINRLNSNKLDLDKLYDVSRIKAEATGLLEERNELKVRLAEVEGAYNLLEEHVKVVKEEIATLSEQCKVAEKEKKDAETRLEVLRNFFEEKEAQRQKEEAIWLQQQGEVVSTVERIQTMQNEIQNYKQQIEMLKREILDQEREYKNQISVLETKAHEQWVVARQVERRLEESKVEAGQLRNRLTLIEKNINEVDAEAKLHRLEANGETTTSPPLFIGAESSSSPIMFSGSSSVPLPPPPLSYIPSRFPPYFPPPLPNTSGVPPYEVSQRPPPLGGRLSSPPPMPLHPPASNRYDNAGSPPPMSPRLLPPFNHRSPPPPFGSDIHPPPPPPGSILPPPLGTAHSWGEESLPPPRNSGFHPAQRERVRNHKGSLHSSGESLDKSHHNSKV